MYTNNNYNNQIIISGPCSVESKEQLYDTAKGLKKIGIDFLRGGVWKPRTKPGGFEGLGEIALGWMKEIKDTLGFKICCEVANKEQTELALRYDVDAIWVGARTTSDPFAVQEIAETIKEINQNIIVFIKNPTCVDIDLWEGAYLRFKALGINNIGFIHRGFKAYKKTEYRNNPLWQYALQMKIKYPNIPMICDPSHIAGKRDYIEDICKKAYMYNYDGYIIESHCNPDKAWTDAGQQLLPEDLKKILDKVYKHKNIDNLKLSNYRKDIDSIDMQILDLISQRFEITNKIGELKKEVNMNVYQPNRFNEILKNLKSMNKISENLVDEIWGAIHEESVNEQNIIIKENEK